MLVKMNCANGITGLDPQLPSENRVPIQRASGTMKQWTIDLSKHYILTIGFRYSDPTFRTNQYYITNGRVKDLTNNQGVTDCSVELSGTTLTVKGGSSSSSYVDISLTEVGIIGEVSGEVPLAEALTTVTGTNSYTLLKDYKYLVAQTWDTGGGDWTNAGTLNDEYADEKIIQSYMSTMVWYDVKQGDIYKNIQNGTLRLTGFA